MLHLASSWCLTKSHILDTDRETNQTDKKLNFLRIGVHKRISLLLNLNLKHQNSCWKRKKNALLF